MNRVLPYCLFIGVVLFAASALAEDMPKNGCSLQGSWMNNEILATYNGLSVSSGNIIEETPVLNPTLFGTFPTAVKVSSWRGMWTRTGGNTFAYTQIGYGFDAEGNLLWIGKNSGNKTLTEDCNLMTVESTLEVFLPGVNPFEGAPYFKVPLGIVYLHRMRVDPPATFD